MTTKDDGINYPKSFNAQQREDFKSLTIIGREAILNCREGMLKSEAYFHAPSSKTKTLKTAAVNFSNLLKNPSFKRLYESVTTTSYSKAMDMRARLSDRFEQFVYADDSGVDGMDVKPSDVAAMSKQYIDLHDLNNSKYIGRPIELEGLGPLDALDKIAVEFASGHCHESTVRTLVTVYKAKVDLKNDIEMQERVENIESMLEDARKVK